MKQKPKKTFKISTNLILISLIIGLILISWICYWINPNNTAADAIRPLGILEIFSSPIKGFINSASIIIFLFSVGAFIHQIKKSHSLEILLGNYFKRHSNHLAWIGVFFILLFAAFGSVSGLTMTSLMYYYILIPVIMAITGDKFIALLIIGFGSGIGVMASTVDPVVVATSFAFSNQAITNQFGSFTDNVPQLTTGMGLAWRAISFFVLTSIVCLYVFFYIKKRQPNFNHVDLKQFTSKQTKLNTNQKIIAWIFLAMFIILIMGNIPWDGITNTTFFESIGKTLSQSFPYIFGQNPNKIDNMNAFGDWTIVEIAVLFLIATVIIGIFNVKNSDEWFNNFAEGSASMLNAVILVSLCQAINILLNESNIALYMIDQVTALKYGINAQVLTLLIFMLFFAIAFFVPSRSAFPALVFPIIAPALTGMTINNIDPALVNGSGLTVSGSILCFSFASGLVNLIMPTGIFLVISLRLCNISFGEFYKKNWLLILILFVAALALLMTGTLVGNNLF